MYWILQENLFQEVHWNALIETLERLELPHSVHKIVPFTNKLFPEIAPDGPVIVMGAIRMATIAKERGWKPGSFENGNFDFVKQRKHWGDLMLNADAIVCNFEDVPSHRDEIVLEDDHFFMRPVHDTKSFTGMVTNWTEFMDWHKKLGEAYLADSRCTVKPHTPVVVCSPKVIYWEYRLWVVDGKVVTSSAYKAGGRLMVTPVVNQAAIEFAEAAVKQWAPARAFVIDIADTPDGPKIIEVNNINSAGFYASNVGRMIEALEGMLW